MGTIQVGTTTINVESVERMIAEEWQARRPTAEYPGGFSPLQAFKDQVQRLRDLKFRFTGELEEKMALNQPVDRRDIHALRQLERLTFMAESDPHHSRRREGLEMLAKGRAPSHGGLTDSAKLENYVDRREGPGQGRERFTVAIDHG